MAASESAAAATATPLAQSLSAALAKPPGDLDAISAAIRKDLAGSGVALAVFGNGGGASLVAAAAPAPPARPPPAAPAIGMPAEGQYSLLDRRRVQAALRLLGYYGGVVDGVFGPQTRAAIRHYQHDAGVPQTGTLTPQQAARLLAGLPLTGR
jgi:peptidoglycan hydrolase-like protein with peptidoglycan-binding domain